MVLVEDVTLEQSMVEVHMPNIDENGGQPEKSDPAKWSQSDRLGAAFGCLAAIMAIILYLIEKTRLSITLLLSLMVLLAVFPVMHFFQRLTVRVLVLSTCLVLTIVFGWRLWPGHAEGILAPANDNANLIAIKPEQPLTLRALYDKEFSDTLKSTREISFSRIRDKRKFTFTGQMYSDFFTHANFFGFYVSGDDVFSVCGGIANNINQIMKQISDGPYTQMQSLGNTQQESSKNLTFSGRVYIYYEGYLSPKEIGELIDAFKVQGVAAQFRGWDYLAVKAIERSVPFSPAASPTSTPLSHTQRSYSLRHPSQGVGPQVTFDGMTNTDVSTVMVVRGNAKVTTKNMVNTRVGRVADLNSDPKAPPLPPPAAPTKPPE